ncbi:NAD(P)-binding domain-containing protein [Paenarthrobacter sp. Z7-10]|uniref:NADPH-dependent F420 reductase n=1 Tax=Paenarthrobacter sp. Z7-10 TaxID=2787635 RepID=UPI0022A9D7B4|nr:NAD(P)-binding domain-containing protein [Paenarthrobacter sp. Z7-10]MCZ2402765.1 NAD(P)-binding domain-containing protein [Paenarthrobacter sp. Z7-10]
MKIAILGTGRVGQTLAGKFVQLGHEVTMGSRDAANPKAVQWAASAGGSARADSFSGAAQGAEVILNATAGTASLQALQSAGSANLDGKVLIDVANPLDFSAGFPPSLSVVNTDSLAETIQRVFPAARVVKTLNTMTADLMVNPQLVAGGDHDVFVAGDDGDAKAVVVGLLGELGWEAGHIRDLGGLDAARALEMYLPLWLRLMMTFDQSGRFNIRIVSA